MGALTVAVLAIALGFTVVAGLKLRPSGRSYAGWAHLLEPRIVTLPARTVLQVLAIGDPAVVGRRAFGLLMRAYFRLPGVPRSGPKLPAPRARWYIPAGRPRSEWTGLYAIPVPDTVTEPPRVAPVAGLRVELTAWPYGEVAEILHVGPYDTEAPTLEGLRRFVEQQRYVVTGEHEEEYVKGPGPTGRGDPRHYLTIIRYRVRPASAPVAEPSPVPEATRSR